MKLKKLIDGRLGIEMEGGFDRNDITISSIRNQLNSHGFALTVDGGGTDCYHDGYEWYTNSHDGIDIFSQLDNHLNEAFDVIDELNFKTNARYSGLHINISRYEGCTNTELFNIIHLFYGLEELIFSLIHPARKNNGMSGRLEQINYSKKDFLNDIFNSNVLEQEQLNLLQMMNEAGYNNKFNPLSFHKYQGTNCIEFRLFDAEPNNLIYYINMVQHILDISRNRTIYQIRKMIDKIKDKRTLKAKQLYFLKRIGFTSSEAKKVRDGIKK